MLRLEKMFGLVYSPRERVTTCHHGSQVSSFLSSYKDSTFLSIFAVPNNAVSWITSNLTFTPIRFMYSLKLADAAPRAQITTGTTMTFRMHRTFAVSSFNSWNFSNFSSSLIFHPVITWDGNINYDNLSLFLINKGNVWSSCLNFPITLDCEIPEFLIFTFQHSLRLLFIPVASSFQFTFTTKLPVDIPCHVIMPTFIFCLRQITALTHRMSHRFSLAPAHSAQR